MFVRTGRRALVALGVLASGAALALGPAAVPAGASPAPAVAPQVPCSTPLGPSALQVGRAIVSAKMTPFGMALVIDSSPFKGCSLYELTADTPSNPVTPNHLGCTGGCAAFEWPALLTSGAPIAGTGVNPALLGTVARKTLEPGHTFQQVTYGGHPLYRFFVDTTPGNTRGEDLFDPGTTPPGIWYLVQPGTGNPVTVPLTFKDMTVPTPSGTRDVLTVSVDQGLATIGLGPLPVPVYTFSGDMPNMSMCTGTCAVFWPPVRVKGAPMATGNVGGHLGAFVNTMGIRQAAFNQMPLYLFVQDVYLPLPTFGPTHTHLFARGTGVTAFGGTFHLVPAPAV